MTKQTIETHLTKEEIQIYSRHFTLPHVGLEGQKKLKNARVLCIGAGGLGSPLLLYLAAAGVGTIGIVDDDHVELSNLQRQVLYSRHDRFMKKAEAARKRLQALNPFIKIETHVTRLREENALDLVAQYDIVADGTDNFATRYLVNDACFTLKKPNVYASIYQFEGQCSIFTTQNGPCYRCLYRSAPPAELMPNCAEGGVFGILPAIMGSIQATEVVKLILGIGEPLVGRLLTYNALDMHFGELEIRRDPDCVLCKHRTPFEKVSRQAASCDIEIKKNDVVEIKPAELRDLSMTDKNFTLIDVRNPYENEICNIGGLLIPLFELPERLKELDRQKNYIVYCKMGTRGKKAVELLQQHGFKNVRNLQGGIMAWIDKVDGSLARY